MIRGRRDSNPRPERHVAVIGNERGRPARTWQTDTTTGETVPLTPEGVRGRQVSPNGRLLAVSEGNDRYLLDLQTQSPIHVKGWEITDNPIGFSADSTALFVVQPDTEGARIFRLDFASGTRTLVRTLHPAYPSGFVGLNNVYFVLDGQHLAFNTGWLNSQLFLMKLR